ncbi:MAG TPA: hypothetical protein VHR86_03180 [Armatimonadota bacterium]|nr:hypothetical protein [Armatimonadota bacterium]
MHITTQSRMVEVGVGEEHGGDLRRRVGVKPSHRRRDTGGHQCCRGMIPTVDTKLLSIRRDQRQPQVKDEALPHRLQLHAGAADLMRPALSSHLRLR